MSLKLYYWNATGAAQAIRILLHYLKVDFEEINPTKETWPALKQSFVDGGFTFANLPMIDEGDFKLSQSKAVLFYLAQTRGDGSTVGKTPRDQAIVRQLVGVVDDLLGVLRRGTFTEDYKTKLQEVAADQKLIRIVEGFEKRLSDGREFLLGYFTIADIAISGVYNAVNHVYKSAEVKNPLAKQLLYDHAVRVANLSGIKEYYASDEYQNKPMLPLPWVKRHPLTPPEE